MMERSDLSKKDQVRNYLIRELQSGKYPKGAVFLSENTLIQRLGICKNTVREAYSSLVSDGLLERIRGKGTFVIGFESRHERETFRREVRLFIGDPMHNHEDDPFVGAIVTGLHAALDPFDWRIRLKCMDTVENGRQLLQALDSELHPGDNAVLAGFDFPSALTDPLLEKGVRLLTVGRPEDKRIPFAHNDYRGSMYETVKSLIALGHTQIALADRRTSHLPSFEERRDGYIQALSEAGIIPDARLMAEYRGFDISCGDEIWNRLKECGVPYSAIVIYGDWATLGFLRNAAASGIRVPEDLSLVSCCNTPLQLADLRVTRIAARHSELGKAVGKLLMNPEGSPENCFMVAPRLVEGNTVMQRIQNKES